MKRLLILIVCLLVSNALADSQTVTVSSQAASIPLKLNLDVQRFSVGVGIICTVSAGAVLTYEVDVTGDDPIILLGPVAKQHWNPHDTLQGLTNSTNGNLAFPVIAIRINVTSYSSGSVTCSMIQANPF